MNVDRCWKTFVCFLVFVLSGCAGYTTKLSKDDKPTEKDAYLYGRFFIEAQVGKLLPGVYTHQSMGLSIECSSGENYTLRFSKDDPLQVIKIKPSTCSLNELVFTYPNGRVASRKPAPAGILKDAGFDPGKAYYLGDFAAEGTQSVEKNILHSRWRMTSMKDNYEASTREMRLAYLNLAAVPTENRMMGKKAFLGGVPELEYIKNLADQNRCQPKAEPVKVNKPESGSRFYEVACESGTIRFECGQTLKGHPGESCWLY